MWEKLVIREFFLVEIESHKSSSVIDTEVFSRGQNLKVKICKHNYIIGEFG